ncbi:MAG TPA: DUF481 domain-containing protein [Vicinamibacterales bacterium]|jgi:hypothetical protein|nr:DUF481 domain-containing protein [Vicinamibacterales bacterium]
MRTLMTIALVACVEAAAYAQGKTDVVILANGDRITGEIAKLERGRLEFKTDDAGTLYLEWDKLLSVVAANRFVEVLTTTGTRFLGPLLPATDRAISVGTSEGAVTLQMAEVTLITPIGTSFWRKLDGSIDVGFSSTQSSGVAQLNVNSETVYRKPAFSARLTGALTLTKTDDEEGRDDRGYVEASYLRYPWHRWFITSATRFETNESLGLELRSQIWVAGGPRLVNSNRAQMVIGGGLSFNDERGVDVEATQNIEALGLFRWSYYTYDRPKTNLDVDFQYYPSLNNWGRQRLQLDAGVKRELLTDLFVAVSLYNTFDSRPPNPDANTNDIGIVVSIGWSY